jgi:hypothetical protein
MSATPGRPWRGKLPTPREVARDVVNKRRYATDIPQTSGRVPGLGEFSSPANGSEHAAA